MPARVKPSFLARAKRFLCARRRGGAKFQRLPPSVMVIGVQPFEVWRASNVLHSSLRAHHQPAASFFLSLPPPSLSSFSLFLSPGVTILYAPVRGVSGILKFHRRGGEDFESREKSRPLTTRSRVNSREGGGGRADRDQIREISDPSFSAGELKRKKGRGRREAPDDWIDALACLTLRSRSSGERGMMDERKLVV